jgi:lysophospholipase L1-like esterase
MSNYPLAFFLNIVRGYDFPLEDDDPMYYTKGGSHREATEDVKAFLAVLASFSELNDKKLFVFGPDRFIAALVGGVLPGNTFPIWVDLNSRDWYTLDMHPNKQGHRKIAAQIFDQLKLTEQGRHCLVGEP